ncbi:MAG: dTMP kinase [Candidatus Hydrothermae bacterium]|nr:dTMP kinase [Candidatus Hydrothermae bacterium]
MGRWGLFVTLEGIEGSGKSTLGRMLMDALQAHGIPVTATREPGGTPAAEAIREALLHPSLSWDPWAETFAMLAARRENVVRVILPALREGQVVLCDRFMDSTYAYQGYGRGLPLRVLSRLHRFVLSGVRPHLTLLVDLPVADAFRRLNRSFDRFEQEERAFHERVREGYLRLARRAKKRFLVLDGRKAPEDLLQEALPVVLARYHQRRKKRLPSSGKD